MKKIVIDAGHGMSDTGAKAINGEFEKDINLEVAMFLKDLAKPYKDKLELIFTRTTDVYIGLVQRAEFANNHNADLFVSIHHNAYMGYGKGAEVIHSIHGGKGKEFAYNLMEKFLKTGISQRRVFYRESTKYEGKDYYTVINKTNMPAVITEYCFIDSKVDFPYLTHTWQRKQEAECILKAILQHFRIEEIKEVEPKDNKPEEVKSMKNYKEILEGSKLDAPEEWIKLVEQLKNGNIDLEKISTLKWLYALSEKVYNNK